MTSVKAAPAGWIDLQSRRTRGRPLFHVKRRSQMRAAWFDKAIKAGYLVDSSRQHNKANVWFDYCKCKGHPYVVIRPGRKNSWVEIDLIGQNYNLHPIAANEICQLLETHRGDGKGAFWSVARNTPVIILMGNVRQEWAEPIARKMVALASNPKFQVDLESSYRWHEREWLERQQPDHS